jgi:hypothetical protein
MNNMLPVLVLFGLLLWYINYTPSIKDYSPKISRSINKSNIKEYEIT